MQIFYAYYCNCSFVCLFLTTYKCKRLHLNSVKTGDDIQVVPKKMRWSSVRNLMCVGRYGISRKILVDWNKNIKKPPFSDASASHLLLVVWCGWFQAEAWISHTTSPTPPSYESSPHCPKDKNRSPFHGEKPLVIKWFIGKKTASNFSRR